MGKTQVHNTVAGKLGVIEDILLSKSAENVTSVAKKRGGEAYAVQVHTTNTC